MHFLHLLAVLFLLLTVTRKLQIPLALVVIVHHAAFGYLQFIGFDKIYFTQCRIHDPANFYYSWLSCNSLYFFYVVCGPIISKYPEELQIAQANEIEKDIQ